MGYAESMLEHAQTHPYDDRPPKDNAQLAALAVLADLRNRRGIGHELEQVDRSIREEIVDDLAAIIRAAAKTTE